MLQQDTAYLLLARLQQKGDLVRSQRTELITLALISTNKLLNSLFNDRVSDG